MNDLATDGQQCCAVHLQSCTLSVSRYTDPSETQRRQMLVMSLLSDFLDMTVWHILNVMAGPNRIGASASRPLNPHHPFTVRPIRY